MQFLTSSNSDLLFLNLMRLQDCISLPCVANLKTPSENYASEFVGSILFFCSQELHPSQWTMWFHILSTFFSYLRKERKYSLLLHLGQKQWYSEMIFLSPSAWSFCLMSQKFFRSEKYGCYLFGLIQRTQWCPSNLEK